MDLAWSKENLMNEASAEPLKKKPRYVSRDLCYVTVNYMYVAYGGFLVVQKRMPGCCCVQF